MILRINPAQPTVQTEPQQKSVMDSPSYRLLAKSRRRIGSTNPFTSPAAAAALFSKHVFIRSGQKKTFSEILLHLVYIVRGT